MREVHDDAVRYSHRALPKSRWHVVPELERMPSTGRAVRLGSFGRVFNFYLVFFFCRLDESKLITRRSLSRLC